MPTKLKPPDLTHSTPPEPFPCGGTDAAALPRGLLILTGPLHMISYADWYLAYHSHGVFGVFLYFKPPVMSMGLAKVVPS